jgi:hypothetical protein
MVLQDWGKPLSHPSLPMKWVRNFALRPAH